MKVLVTGSSGQLGKDLILELQKRNIDFVGIDIDRCDLTDRESVQRVFVDEISKGVDSIIHLAAYTAVDKAQDEQDIAYKVNVLATKHIVEVAKEYDIKLMYISTDYVFNGIGNKAFDINDEKKPLNVYGQTKYEGELELRKLKKYFILRISWVFGIYGNNFIKTMIKLSKERDNINVVNDQIGSPTYTKDVSVLICDMISTNKYGVYHASNEGYCSWYDFACEIFKQANINVKVNPVDSCSFVTKAVRPKNSKLDKKCLDDNGFNRLPTWQDAIHRYLIEENIIRS